MGCESGKADRLPDGDAPRAGLVEEEGLYERTEEIRGFTLRCKEVLMRY